MRRLRSEAGFSLAEAVISMVLTVVIVTAAISVLTVANHWTTDTQSDQSVQTLARSFVDTLVADFRQAYNGDLNTPPVEAIGSTLTFDSPDRLAVFHVRRISIRLNGTKIERSISTSTNTTGPPWTYPVGTPPWITQVTSVSAFSITYLDASGVVTATPSAVRTIQISLTIKTPGTKSRSFTYTSRATLRETQS